MPDDLAVQQQFFSLILEAEEGLATISSYTARICHCNTVSVVQWTPLFFPIVLNKWKLHLLCHRSIWFTEYLTASLSLSESVLRVVWMIDKYGLYLWSTRRFSPLGRCLAFTEALKLYWWLLKQRHQFLMYVFLKTSRALIIQNASHLSSLLQLGSVPKHDY